MFRTLKNFVCIALLTLGLTTFAHGRPTGGDCQEGPGLGGGYGSLHSGIRHIVLDGPGSSGYPHGPSLFAGPGSNVPY
jgi:hypothetical protein